MIERVPIEFWVVFQIAVDLILVVLILYLVRSMRSGLNRDMSREASERLLQMIEPVLLAAKSTSKSFETQLLEKSQLINQLNQRLDSKIIALNLLLNRADNRLTGISDTPAQSGTHVYDQQKLIDDLHQKGADADAIAKQLSLPKGEVELVLDLKNKLMAME